MPKQNEYKYMQEFLLKVVTWFKISDNPFSDLNDATALSAAAQIVETAAFNLAPSIRSKEIAELIVISHQLAELSRILPTQMVPPPQRP